MNGPTHIQWHVGPNVSGNPVVQCNSQEREDPLLAEEFKRRQELQRWARRAARLAEGGRGGGLNDRQMVERREFCEDSEIDDFGRRVSRARPAPAVSAGGAAASGGRSAMSKAERMQAALERLRPKRGTAPDAAERAGDSEGRARSRSPRSSRSRSLRSPRGDEQRELPGQGSEGPGGL